MAVENDLEQSEATAARLLELLLCIGELAADVEVLSRSVDAAV